MKTFQKEDFFTPKAVSLQQFQSSSPWHWGGAQKKAQVSSSAYCISLWRGRKQYLVQVSLLLSSPTKACLGVKSCLLPWALLQTLLSRHRGQEKKKEKQVALYHSAPFYLPASDLLVLLSLNKSFNFLQESLTSTKIIPGSLAVPRSLPAFSGRESHSWDLKKEWGGRSRTQGWEASPGKQQLKPSQYNYEVKASQ